MDDRKRAELGRPALRGLAAAAGSLFVLLAVLLGVAIRSVLADADGGTKESRIHPGDSSCRAETTVCGATHSTGNQHCGRKTPPVKIFLLGNMDATAGGGNTPAGAHADALQRIADELRDVADGLIEADVRAGDRAGDGLLDDIRDRLNDVAQRLVPPLPVQVLSSAKAKDDSENGGEQNPR